jgi:tetratricopeptide (TPR) repeat protein
MELDEQHVVELALALDAVGLRDEAMEVLRASPHVGTDAQGTLAGRLKRSWLSLGKQRDATSALELYRDAYAAAAAAGDHEQAAYLGINVAFLELTFEHDPNAARDVATDVLNSCARSRPGHWRSATAGEAELHLGDRDAALAAYREAVALEPTPRELESMYVQASRLIAELGDQRLQHSLDEVLRPAASPS